jgi:hypothetical protein
MKALAPTKEDGENDVDDELSGPDQEPLHRLRTLEVKDGDDFPVRIVFGRDAFPFSGTLLPDTAAVSPALGWH